MNEFLFLYTLIYNYPKEIVVPNFFFYFFYINLAKIEVTLSPSFFKKKRKLIFQKI